MAPVDGASPAGNTAQHPAQLALTTSSRPAPLTPPPTFTHTPPTPPRHHSPSPPPYVPTLLPLHHQPMTALSLPSSTTNSSSLAAPIPTPLHSLLSLLLLPLHILQRVLALLATALRSLAAFLPLPAFSFSSLPSLLPYTGTKESLNDRWLLPPPIPATPASTPTGLLTPPGPPGRRERQPLTLHVPPSYKSLSLSRNPSSPRPILKVRTPSEWSEFDVEDLEGGEEHDHEQHEQGGNKRERDERVIRFDSVPDIWWIERAERRRSTSKPRPAKEEPGLWESWFAGMALPQTAATREAAFGARMRYDQMVC
ncbi:hypothetical protein CALCODRAFT_482101 [Calocera cornea HHB12733]|uniref:Uncharacterized protein n=1 Tax=Calocera cornea HHB12733 TaxID=1353952 RepID=A0A165H3T3_9BASI|nr:hypothetical protein CALCODRAFT_482101 [Calocera cornea HHB12733]